MQDYLVVFRVSLMVVPRPVRSPQMNFHGPIPLHLAEAQAGIEEVGAGIGVAVARA